jgi:hypothetical protein
MTGSAPLRRVAVIGAGVAGTGAAWAAAEAGADVLLFDGGPGASVLATGALDFDTTAGTDLPASVVAFLDSFGGYRVAPDVRLVTTAGVVRAAAGHDVALLDVSAAAGSGPIGVVDCDRPGWDARALARAWGDGFEVVEAPILRHTDERRLPDADFAGRHDEPERLAWLGARLREALERRSGRFAALVLPPSLGQRQARARELSEIAGVECGEAIGLPGGPAGLRFENGRERALAGARVTLSRARAHQLSRAQHVWRVHDDGHVVDVGAVVVATGGLLGGGIEYRSPTAAEVTEGRPLPGPALRMTFGSPLVIGAHGKPLEPASSTYGAVPEGLAWPASAQPILERAGVLLDGEGQGPAPGLFAAGDVVADAPRTWLRALAGGLRAGAAAARFTSGVVEASPTRP